MDLVLVAEYHGRVAFPSGTVTALGLVGVAAALLLLLSTKQFETPIPHGTFSSLPAKIKRGCVSLHTQLTCERRLALE